jgi:3-hydroxyisobutyrate dehydrogenase-like beta-hydroxyacid dehydrogenase
VSPPGLIVVLGLGEAGSRLAHDLAAAGARVRGFDPVREAPDGVEPARGPADAAAGACIVLSVNSAAVALEVAESVAPVLAQGGLFADLNTGPPALKRAAAEIVDGRGARFADVALLGVVPERGLTTPALASGSGAHVFADVFEPLGMPVTQVGSDAGAAAARKLARSVFMKGLAAAVGEALTAGERLECEDWLYTEIEAALTGADAGLLHRLIEGSRRHAGRRVEEMGAAVEMLEELGVEPRVAAASEAWLRSLDRSEVPR